MMQNEHETTHGLNMAKVFSSIHADIARARREARRAAARCTSDCCVCREPHSELMLRILALRKVQELPLGHVGPGDEPFLSRNRMQHYQVRLEWLRRTRCEIAHDQAQIIARGLSLADNPPRSHAQKKRDKMRALYTEICVREGRDPWKRRHSQ